MRLKYELCSNRFTFREVVVLKLRKDERGAAGCFWGLGLTSLAALRAVLCAAGKVPLQMVAEKGSCLALSVFFFFFFTLVTGPRRSLSRKRSDTRVYGPQIRSRAGTTAYFC